MSHSQEEPHQREPHDGHQPPAGLSPVPSLFWSVRPEFETLRLDEAQPGGEVLGSLGAPQFPKTGFPFLGYLATVYDHVVSRACGQKLQ